MNYGNTLCNHLQMKPCKLCCTFFTYLVAGDRMFLATIRANYMYCLMHELSIYYARCVLRVNSTVCTYIGIGCVSE